MNLMRYVLNSTSWVFQPIKEDKAKKILHDVLINTADRSVIFNKFIDVSAFP